MIKNILGSCSCCGSENGWTRVCDECGKEFCESCGLDEYTFPTPTCPRCQSDNVRHTDHKNFKGNENLF